MTRELSAADANEPGRPGVTLRYLPSPPPAYPIRYGLLLTHAVLASQSAQIWRICMSAGLR